MLLSYVLLSRSQALSLDAAGGNNTITRISISIIEIFVDDFCKVRIVINRLVGGWELFNEGRSFSLEVETDRETIGKGQNDLDLVLYIFASFLLYFIFMLIHSQCTRGIVLFYLILIL